MTSKPNLSLVRREAAATSGSQAESLVRQWDPEYQLVGALLHLPRDRVEPILELVPSSAIWQLDSRWAFVMYSRTLFGSPAKLVLDTLFRRWCALAANPEARD